MQPGDDEGVQIELLDRKLPGNWLVAFQAERELPLEFRVRRFGRSRRTPN